MNKKFLSVVLFGALMAGSSVTFTGCIDNDEPTGIEDLRGAKSELIRANAALTLVKVELKKVKVEREQVDLELDKVKLELARLDIEAKKDSSAYASALWQGKKDSVIAFFKGKVFDLEKEAAENEKKYLIALAELKAATAFVTDSVYAEKLNDITDSLKSARWGIVKIQNKITEAMNNVLAYSSNSYAEEQKAVARQIKTYQSDLANDSITLAEFKKLAEDYNGSAISQQITDIDKQILAIDAKVAELMQSVTTIEGEAAPIEQAISKEQVTLEAQKHSVALEVPAAIESAFIQWAIGSSESPSDILNELAGEDWAKEQADNNVNWKTQNMLNEICSFKKAPVIEKLALGELGEDNTVAEANLLSTKLTNLGAKVKEHALENYYGAYNNIQSISDYTLPTLDENMDEISAGDKAKIEVALAKVNVDLATAKTAYETDTAAFNKDYAAYKAAATAYGITQQLNETIEKGVAEKFDAYVTEQEKYDDSLPDDLETLKTAVTTATTALSTAKEAYDKLTAAEKNNSANTTVIAYKTAIGDLELAQGTYDEAIKDVDDTDLKAAIKALKDELTAYYPKRKALVGDVFKITDAKAAELKINKNKGFVISEALATLSDTDFSKLMVEGNEALVYGATWTNTTVNWKSTENDGAVQTWIKTSERLYGMLDETGKHYKPTILTEAMTKSSTAILPLSDVWAQLNTADVQKGTLPSAGTYVMLQNAKDAFSTIDTWTDFAETFATKAETFSALEEPVVAEIVEQAEALKNLYEPLRDTIYEICKLDIDQWEDNLDAIGSKLGIEIMNKDGEKQTLEALRATLIDEDGKLLVTDGTLTLSYQYYTAAEESGLELHTDGKVEKVSDLTKSLAEEGAIARIENSIKLLNQEIAAQKDLLAKYENNTATNDDREKTKAQYEAVLASLQERLKDQQAIFDAWDKAREELIKAMGAE